jgi:hypothetical protein
MGKGLTRSVYLVLFVMACLPLASCEARPARAEEARQATTVWRAVGAWSGDGSRQTESFEVVTGALRLRWEARAQSTVDPSRFHVWLYSAISGRPLQTFVDHEGAGSGTAHLADDPRVSYLVIESEHTQWTAVLEEAVRTADSYSR